MAQIFVIELPMQLSGLRSLLREEAYHFEPLCYSAYPSLGPAPFLPDLDRELFLNPFLVNNNTSKNCQVRLLSKRID